MFIYKAGSLGWLNWMDDATYLRMMYRLKMGKSLDLDNPKTFNEKLQWLKIHDRKPEYTTMVDKIAAKKYVADIIGEEYIIPTLGVWNHFDEIDFDKLPDQFVLKCNHDSGGLVIVRDKAKLDKAAAKKKLEKCLKRNYYWSSREWPYKNVPPKIFAEEYMEDTAIKELRDYKIFTFDGMAKALFIATDRQKVGEEVKFDFYDVDFKHIPFRQGHENATIQPKKPETFDQMLKLAEKLAEGIPQVRVDFYEVNGVTYFGELTFSHFGGMTPFNPEEWDEKLGELITLPEEFGGGVRTKV